MTAAGEGVRLIGTDLPATSVSHRLTSAPPICWPHRWTSGSPNCAGATTGIGPSRADPVGAAVPAGVDAAMRAFAGLIGRQRLTAAFALFALFALLAMILGWPAS